MSDPESVARRALAEIGPADTIGDLYEQVSEGEGVSTLRFVSTLSGYPGWHWAVSVAELPGEEPTVLEAELMPGDGALLAPDWVPWAERLEDYRAAQEALAAENAEADDADADDESDDDDADDDDDFDPDSDDDLGDDDLDGIDFESLDLPGLELSGVPAGRDDEQDESESESADDGPEQPDEP